MDIQALSKQLNIEINELLTKASKINLEYGLGVKDFSNLTRTQYDILRSAFDLKYMVKMFKGSRVGAKYNYSNTMFYADVSDWIATQDLRTRSSVEIKRMLPDHMNSIGKQALAATLKENGYYSKVVYLGEGKQGRRWFKDTAEPSFF